MTNVGKVYLVGAGPGDPGLLTLRGYELLQRADVVLYDGLVHPLVLAFAKGELVRTSRANKNEDAAKKQSAIHELLIGAAREGKTVVRLKGGDPLIFGRGGEEALALTDAEIPYEIVPGITAATAACAYAGIPLTHRESASAVALITGHEDPTKPESSLDYGELAKFPGTLVFYMGLHRLEAIVDALIAAGRNPAEAAAVISQATTPMQQTVTAALSELPTRVREANVHAPSVIVVGAVADLRSTIQWVEKRPLFGKRIGITRAEGQSSEVIKQAWELGAEPVLMPMIEILPPDDWAAVDAVIDRLNEFDWLIFTSANGVRGLLDRLYDTGHDLRKLSCIQLAAIGPATAETLNAYHLRADLVPTEYRGEALADALSPLVCGKKVLWARANRGRDIIPEQLKASGADYEEIVVYNHRDVASLPDELQIQLAHGSIDWITLSSPAIARQFRTIMADETLSALQEGKFRLVSISPVTTAAANEVGLPISAEATEYTWNGIFQAIRRAEEISRGD
ncbi:MAG: uroporphyrinogen-III C-methyltransferase [Planctomycetota bacterium]|nr:uroporphyrinogen-III C-methyltransferase [Planctomycetota bacterium]MDA1211929.1 uroporphyrinogen-III C-methyltransferase [Planctomycetota bacterium]